MAQIYRPPPSPFVGGRQPLGPADLSPAVEAVEANDPPFAKRARVALLAVLVAWQPVPAAPQVARPSAPVAAAATDAPPLGRGWQVVTNHQWQAPPPRPQARPPRDPALLAVAEDAPPIGLRLWLSSVLRAWQAPPPPPPSPWRVPASVAAVAEDDPPFGRRPWLSPFVALWQPPRPTPQTTRPVPAVEAVASTDLPFSRAWLAGVVQGWAAPAPTTRARWTLAPALLSVAADDPPFTTTRRQADQTVRARWDSPVPRQPTAVLGVHAVAVDDPPFGLRLWFSSVVATWQPLAPPTARARGTVMAVEVRLAAAEDTWIVPARDDEWTVEAPDLVWTAPVRDDEFP